MARARSAREWRDGFLRALAASGNVRVAAREARVAHSRAYAARKRDQEFAARWAAALDAAAAHMGGYAPVEGGALPGLGELTAEALVMRRSRNAGTQLVRAGAGRWSLRVEREFLETLARSACVRVAADAVGMSTTAVYARRKLDGGFRERWEAAAQAGEERIGDLLTAAVLAAFDPQVAAAGVPRATVAETIAIARLKGIGGRRSQARAEDAEAARASILRKLEAIERAEARGMASGEAGQ